MEKNVHFSKNIGFQNFQQEVVYFYERKKNKLDGTRVINDENEICPLFFYIHMTDIAEIC